MIEDVGDINDYLTACRRPLGQRTKQHTEPLSGPGQISDERLHRLLKPPYQAQGDRIMGVSEFLTQHNSAVVAGETGCGKTLIELALPYVYNPPENPGRTLVTWPGHLVKKRQREAVETVRHADAKTIGRLGDVLHPDGNEECKRPEYLIVSKDRARPGGPSQPKSAVISSPVADYT